MNLELFLPKITAPVTVSAADQAQIDQMDRPRGCEILPLEKVIIHEAKQALSVALNTTPSNDKTYFAIVVDGTPMLGIVLSSQETNMSTTWRLVLELSVPGDRWTARDDFLLIEISYKGGEAHLNPMGSLVEQDPCEHFSVAYFGEDVD